MRRTNALLESALNQIAFMARNILLAGRLPVFPEAVFKDVSVAPCDTRSLAQVDRLYVALHHGQRLSPRNRTLLRIAGSRYCLVVRHGDTIVGMAIYYFNRRDRHERTIHEGYIGLLPEFRGRKIGTRVRVHALRHFSAVPWLNGMSSRISINNPASLKGNLRLGFEPVEEYFDADMKETRCYLVCRFTAAQRAVENWTSGRDF